VMDVYGESAEGLNYAVAHEYQAESDAAYLDP
jgi:hypothetical protein